MIQCFHNVVLLPENVGFRHQEILTYQTHTVVMGSLLARVHIGRVSSGFASSLEPFGLRGLAVARGGDSSAKGRSAQRPGL